METAPFSNTGKSHVLSWGLRQKTALIMQVWGASARGSETGFGKEATPKVRPEGHCCSGVGELCPELALVTPGHEQTFLIVRPIDLSVALSFKQKQYFTESQLVLGSWWVFCYFFAWLQQDIGWRATTKLFQVSRLCFLLFCTFARCAPTVLLPIALCAQLSGKTAWLTCGLESFVSDRSPGTMSDRC